MKLAEFSVRNPQFTIVLFVLLVGLGVTSFMAIPRSEDPIFPIPQFAVVAVLPGGGPHDVEQLIVDPLEKSIKELEDIKQIKSTAEDQLAIINVEFNANSNAERKHDAVLRQVNAVRSELPAELLSLEVIKFSPSNVSIVQAALVSDSVDYKTLEIHARKLKDRIDAIAGVKDSKTLAYPETQVRVSLDLERIAALHVPLGQIIAAVRSDNANIPGGSVDAGRRRFNLESSGKYESLDQIGSTVISTAGVSVIRVRDIAEIAWGQESETYTARLNGHRAVFVTATLQAGHNIFDVRDKIYAEFTDFARTLPAGISFDPGFDQSRNVARRLDHLRTDFVIAILLVLVTLLPLGPRASLIVMISIPLSMAIGTALLYFTGFSLNQLSIVGFVIALGLLVDDSIVVVENISRFIREGHSRRDAAILAPRQIGVAVIGCTATLMFAFLPLLFLPGTPGNYIRSLPASVLCTIGASLVVSLTIIPFLASFILKREEHREGNLVLRGLNWILERSYRRLLHWSIGHPRSTVAAAAVFFVASLGLIPVIGFSLFPKAGIPQFLITIEAPEGSSVSVVDDAARYVEHELIGAPGIKDVFSNIGKGNPSVYYNRFSLGEKSNIGELLVLIDEYDTDKTPKFLDSLRQVYGSYPDAKIEVKEFENGPAIEAPIAMRLVGDDLDTLRLLAAQVEDVMAGTPGTMSVNNPVRSPRTDLRLTIDRDKAGLLGLPLVDIQRAVRLGVAGLSVGQFREENGDEYDIVLGLPRGKRQTVEALDKMYIGSTVTGYVPLRQVATQEFQTSPTEIDHFKQRRAVTVTSDIKTGFNTDRVTKQILTNLRGLDLPTGYNLIPAGEIESRQESFGGFSSAILIAAFGMLVVLILEFRTFRGTLIVASVIPLGVIGGLVALLIGGQTLSFVSMIGFIALMGIEVKNSILLVDFTDQLRLQGLSVDDAIQKAGEIRFVPILLTTLTAIGGLLPLVVEGAPLYAPLAMVVIGGLISSTLLARLVTPVMYKLLAPAL
ncbi:MAG: efflux RND transporter permease subunit [Candidatus Zixiibacteriota bacterium]